MCWGLYSFWRKNIIPPIFIRSLIRLFVWIQTLRIIYDLRTLHFGFEKKIFFLWLLWWILSSWAFSSCFYTFFLNDIFFIKTLQLRIPFFHTLSFFIRVWETLEFSINNFVIWFHLLMIDNFLLCFFNEMDYIDYIMVGSIVLDIQVLLWWRWSWQKHARNWKLKLFIFVNIIYVLLEHVDAIVKVYNHIIFYCWRKCLYVVI